MSVRATVFAADFLSRAYAALVESKNILRPQGG